MVGRAWLAVAVALLAGCSTTAGGETARGEPQPPGRQAGAGEAVVYFVLLEPEERDGRIGTTRSGLLTPRTVEVDDTEDPAVAAIHALMSTEDPGPGLTNSPVTGFGDGRRRFDVASVSHDEGVVVVDFTADFYDPCPTCDIYLPSDSGSIVQQYVLTAQAALGTDDPVEFTARGEPVQGIWGERLDGPVAADRALVVPPEERGSPVAEVDLATESGPPGAPSMTALVSGVVRRDDRGCLGLDSGHGAEAVVWPEDFTAWDAAGGVVLLDDRGVVVAREGDRISAGGGSVPTAPDGGPCLTGTEEVTHVQTEVRLSRPPRA